MTQALPRYPTVEDYLDSNEQIEGRHEYCDGELIELMAESGENDDIAISLLLHFINHAFFPFSLVKAHSCEIQVRKLHPDDRETRLPDLVILRPEHIELTRRRLSIRLNMPAPLLVFEVVSPDDPGTNENYMRDYVLKAGQYANRGICEYWIIDPQRQIVIIQGDPASDSYRRSNKFRGAENVRSQLPELANFQLTAQKILKPQSNDGPNA